MHFVKKPLVSIILNCYNGEKYLKETLLSIKNQTYSNWELIFWDNKSNDNSFKIYTKFKNQKKKYKYFKSNKFVSLYNARNLAIQKAKGQFISFIDADDVWEKDKLLKQLELFKDPKVGVVYGNLWLKKENNNKFKKHIKFKLPEGYIYKNLIKKYYVGIITAVIRKNIIKTKKVFNSKYNIIGDFDLFIKLSRKYKFKAVQEPVATYRLHSNSLSSKFRRLQIFEFIDWLEKNKKNLKKSEYFIIRKNIENMKLLNSKINKNFYKTFIFFLNSKHLKLNFKIFFILTTPIFILKKFMWFL